MLHDHLYAFLVFYVAMGFYWSTIEEAAALEMDEERRLSTISLLWHAITWPFNLTMLFLYALQTILVREFFNGKTDDEQ